MSTTLQLNPENYRQITSINDINLDFTIKLLRAFVYKYHYDILDYFDEIMDLRAWYNYVKNIPYIDYGLHEIIKRQKYTILENCGDCDNKALLIGSYIYIFYPRLEQYFKVIIPEGSENYEHIYNVINYNNKEIILDATYDYLEIGHEFKYKKCLFYKI